MAIAFVSQGGAAGSKAAGSTLFASTPAGGHAVGNTLLVSVAWVAGSTGVNPTVSDVKGNTYTLLAQTPNTNANGVALFGSVLTTALVSGDNIQFSSPGSASKRAISCAEFSGLSLSLDTGPGTNPAINTTDSVNNSTSTLTSVTSGSLVISGLMMEENFANAHSALGSNWQTLSRGGTSGGSNASNIDLLGAYAIANTTSYQAVWQGTNLVDISFIASLQPAATGPQSFSRTASDSLGTTDSASRAAAVRQRTTADTLGTTDAAVQIRKFPRSASDSLGTTDIAGGVLVPFTSEPDVVPGIFEPGALVRRNALVNAPFIRTATETIGTTDSAARQTTAARSASDSIGTTDAAARAPISRTRAASDTLGTTDAATRAAALRIRTATDVLGTTDAAQRSPRTLVRSAIDTLGTTDSAVQIHNLIKTATDVLGTTDSVAGGKIVSRSATDALGTTDTTAQTIRLGKTASDALSTADTAARAAALRIRTAADVLGTSDAAAKTSIRSISATDTIGTTDAATRSGLVLPRGIIDVLGTIDAPPSPTNKISDDFNRADENPLVDGNWSTWGYIGSPLKIVSGQVLSARASSGESASRWLTSFGTRQGIEAFIDIVSTGPSWGQLAFTNDDTFSGDGFQLFCQTSPFSGSNYFRLETYQFGAAGSPGFTRDDFGTTPIAAGDGIGYRLQGTTLQILIRKSGIWNLLFTRSFISTLLVGYPVIDACFGGWVLDNFTVGIPRASRTLTYPRQATTDILGTTDTATRTGGIRPRTSTDILGTTDAATTGNAVVRIASESLGTTDSATRAATQRQRAAADALATSDTTARLIIRSRLATDALGTFDAPARTTARTRNVSDLLGTADSAAQTKQFFRTASDAIGTSDTTKAGKFLHIGAADALGTTDSVTYIGSFSLSATDVLGTTDSTSATVISGGLAHVYRKQGNVWVPYRLKRRVNGAWV